MGWPIEAWLLGRYWGTSMDASLVQRMPGALKAALWVGMSSGTRTT